MIGRAASLWELVERRAEETPDALLAVDVESGTALSFAGYRDAARRAAAGLAARGVAADTPVTWQLPTRLSSLVLVAALARLGAVQNPVLPMHRARELSFAVRQSAARLLAVPPSWRGFDHAALAREIAAAAPGLQILLVDEALPEADPGGLPPPPAASASTRWIFTTSGTTGEPKAARHGDASLAAAASAMAERLALAPDDRVALVFPFTHVGGITWLFAGLMAGSTHLVVPVFDAKATPGLLARHGVTQATAGTVFHQAYLAAQRALPPGADGRRPRLFPRVRAFPGGGAPKPPQLHRDVRAELGGAGIVSGYGMTECPIATMNAVSDPDDRLAHTEGRPTPGMEVRVVRPDGREAPPGEEGEIRVRGPQLFAGYVDAARDAEAFDAQGFFRSGDLGALDATGFLTVTGRLKDVIIRKGENIHAKEVEDHLFEHPRVADVAVIGLPDPEAGERCCAVLVCAPGARVELAELADFLRGRGLAAQKIPERLERVESLPRNTAGKVLKGELRARYAPPGPRGQNS